MIYGKNTFFLEDEVFLVNLHLLVRKRERIKNIKAKNKVVYRHIYMTRKNIIVNLKIPVLFCKVFYFNINFFIENAYKDILCTNLLVYMDFGSKSFIIYRGEGYM